MAMSGRNSKRLCPTVMSIENEKRSKKRRTDESLITKESRVHSLYSSSLRDIDLNEILEDCRNLKGNVDCVTINQCLELALELAIRASTITN